MTKPFSRPNLTSRPKRFWLQLAVAAGAAAFGGEAQAQIGWCADAPGPEVCNTETTVSGVVTEKRTCVRWKPVTETCMRRQDCLTYRDECRTAYRQEQYVQCVPKTCYEQVTVDEGCYQMVWVPKPVTKTVPKTVMEKQLACRNVPYTYVQKVPQMVSRWVPEQRTRYVAETYQQFVRKPFCQAMPTQQTVTAAAPPCVEPAPTCTAPAAPSCSTPVWGGGTFAPATTAPPQTYAPQTTYDPAATFAPAASPYGGAAPTLAPEIQHGAGPGGVPTPTPDPMSFYPSQPTGSAQNATPTWTTVKPRADAVTPAGQPTGALPNGSQNLASALTPMRAGRR